MCAASVQHVQKVYTTRLQQVYNKSTTSLQHTTSVQQVSGKSELNVRKGVRQVTEKCTQSVQRLYNTYPESVQQVSDKSTIRE